jgi:hypothetical protein
MARPTRRPRPAPTASQPPRSKATRRFELLGLRDPGRGVLVEERPEDADEEEDADDAPDGDGALGGGVSEAAGGGAVEEVVAEVGGAGLGRAAGGELWRQVSLAQMESMVWVRKPSSRASRWR